MVEELSVTTPLQDSELAHKVPIASRRLHSIACDDERTAHELATAVCVDTEATEEIANNGSMKVGPLRYSEPEGFASVNCGQVEIDASHKFAVGK
jgi:hypothetical protein